MAPRIGFRKKYLRIRSTARNYCTIFIQICSFVFIPEKNLGTLDNVRYPFCSLVCLLLANIESIFIPWCSFMLGKLVAGYQVPGTNY
jgi:hypothetical protein